MFVPSAANLCRAFRIACWSGVAIVIIAWSILIPLKSQGLLPIEMTWSRILLGPLFLAALTPLIFFTEGKTAKTLLWISVLILLALLIMLLDPAPTGH